jgi:biopolymer transport protein ExbB/TolQ
VFGDGLQTRDYVFAGDVAQANLAAATVPLPSPRQVDVRAFNIGTGRETSVLELAQTLQRAAGTAVPVHHAPARAGELPRSAVAIDKAMKLWAGVRRSTGGWSSHDLRVFRSARSRGRDVIATIAAQGGQPVPTTPLELITASDTVTQVVLGFLALLSAISWTIIFAKWTEYRSVRRAGTKFIQEFERARTLEDAARLAARGKPNPFTRLFMRANAFLAETTPALAATTDRGARLSAAQVEALRQLIDSQTDAERDALGRYLTALATIGSVSPLIGLLGTVLGVISAFLGSRRAVQAILARWRLAWGRH